MIVPSFLVSFLGFQCSRSSISFKTVLFHLLFHKAFDMFDLIIYNSYFSMRFQNVNTLFGKNFSNTSQIKQILWNISWNKNNIFFSVFFKKTLNLVPRFDIIS